MHNQTFLGAFLTFIGLIGLIAMLLRGQFAADPLYTLLSVLPIVLGVIMIVVDQMAKRK